MLVASSFSPVLAAGHMDLNPGLVLWTCITFIILLVLLSRFAWGPIIKMLNERERTIHQAIEQAKKERAEAERLLAEQRASLGQAHKEAAEFVKKNQQEIEALRVELTARARKEADDMVASARRQIDEEKSKAIAELRSHVADLAIQAAGKLIRANLDERAQRALVEEYLAQLPKDRAA